MKHQGSCHCGAVKFEAEGDIVSALSCNCSICRRKGVLMWFVPPSALRLLTPDENTSVYMFNKHVIKHRFCPTCGIHPYGEGNAPSGEAVIAVNLRCIEGIDLLSIPTTEFDGRSI